MWFWRTLKCCRIFKYNYPVYRCKIGKSLRLKLWFGSIISKKTVIETTQLGVVVFTCNPSHLVIQGRRITGSRPASAIQ